MRVVICLPDSQEREFCTRRIKELANSERIPLTLDEISITGIGENYFNQYDFSDMDIIYIGVDRDYDGIGIARSIRKAGLNAVIVFFTRCKDAVFDAFDVEALHYLLSSKISVAKFDEVFRKAVSKAEYRTQESIVLSCAGEQRRIVISQIYYFEVFNRIVTVHYRDGSFEFYSTLSRLEDSLTIRGFIRVHRAYLVQKKFISSVKRNEITLTDGTVIPVGGKYINNINLQ